MKKENASAPKLEATLDKTTGNMLLELSPLEQRIVTESLLGSAINVPFQVNALACALTKADAYDAKTEHLFEQFKTATAELPNLRLLCRFLALKPKITDLPAESSESTVSIPKP